jgi:hypothetical protein
MKRKQHEERSKFTALENHFLNTFFSGLYLSQADLIAIGSKAGLQMQMHSREMLIKELLNGSFEKGTLSQVIGFLNQVIDERIQEYHRLSLAYPNAREPLAKLAQKANGTKSLLARESRGNPYE